MNLLALLDARPMATRFQPRLGHLQRIGLVLNGLAQQINVALDVEDLLLRAMQMHLDIILGLGHFARSSIERVVRLAPIVPDGSGHAVDQCIGAAAQLDRLATLFLGSKKLEDR